MQVAILVLVLVSTLHTEVNLIVFLSISACVHTTKNEVATLVVVMHPVHSPLLSIPPIIILFWIMQPMMIQIVLPTFIFVTIPNADILY